ncbi:RND transporter hydrophobe/amphiphile efflux-1 (HAE1) family [Klebsiella pneumoniae]|uniref:RND transporter hydrophobe/amphiphile efflux-1 (HAE1) family n=1 Tax=Klebsiella pneumoniae TaxID=573 RepID=A0A2X3CKZ0_KLEPN|nr:RND transporter hydrophobe/amphiphile efflux-1 (HAE1) family [Klebsiella pneumoniae]
MSAGRFNLSALAVRERSVTLFLIILISVAGWWRSSDSGERKIRPLRSSK